MTETTNKPERVLISELEAQGYECMGTITKDSTDTDIHKMCVKMADKIVLPAEDSIWDLLAKRVMESCKHHIFVKNHIPNDDYLHHLEKAKAVKAAGGDSEEYWLQVRRIIEGDGGSNV